jgi:hypothetical protein
LLSTQTCEKYPAPQWLVEENRNVVEEVGAMQVMFDALALHPDNVEVRARVAEPGCLYSVTN